jgi:hypothetical protein
MKENEQTERMRQRLRECFEQNPEEGLLGAFSRRIEDPLRPRDENGRFRLNPILLLLAVLIAFTTGAFLLFSIVQP